MLWLSEDTLYLVCYGPLAWYMQYAALYNLCMVVALYVILTKICNELVAVFVLKNSPDLVLIKC